MIERNHIINLSTYEKPCIEESRTKEWVDYLMKLPNGKTEEHYDWLIDRSHLTPKRRSKKVEYVSLFSGYSQILPLCSSL